MANALQLVWPVFVLSTFISIVAYRVIPLIDYHSNDFVVRWLTRRGMRL